VGDLSGAKAGTEWTRLSLWTACDSEKTHAFAERNFGAYSAVIGDAGEPEHTNWQSALPARVPSSDSGALLLLKDIEDIFQHLDFSDI
jgi:hypothetical protein